MEAKIFLDTNCILDILEHRQVGYAPMSQLVKQVAYDRLFISTATVINSHYITRPTDMKKFQNFLMSFQIVGVNKSQLRNAFKLQFSDFEDAVQYVAALTAGCKYLLTRDLQGFPVANKQLQIMSPAQFVQQHL